MPDLRRACFYCLATGDGPVGRAQLLVSRRRGLLFGAAAQVATVVLLAGATRVPSTPPNPLLAASNLTVTRINSEIRTINDMRGKAVATEPIYVERLRARYGIYASEVVGLSNQQLAKAVLSGSLQAVVDDEPVIHFIVATTPGCSLRVLPDTLDQFDYAIALPVGTSQAFNNLLSDGILELQEDGTLEQLQNAFIDNSGQGCPLDGEADTTMLTVGFSNLWGLWVILAAGVCLGAILMILTRTLRKRKKQRQAGVQLRVLSWNRTSAPFRGAMRTFSGSNGHARRNRGAAAAASEEAGLEGNGRHDRTTRHPAPEQQGDKLDDAGGVFDSKV